MNPTATTPTETLLQRRDRLQAEIDERHAQLSSMENDVLLERLFVGLRAVVAMNGWLDVDTFGRQCLHGELTASEKLNDGYDLQKLFGLDGYHDGLHVEMSGLGYISVSANDGKLTLQVTLAKPELLFAFAAKQWVQEQGLSMHITPLERDLKGRQRQVSDIEASIAALKAPPS